MGSGVGVSVWGEGVCSLLERCPPQLSPACTPFQVSQPACWASSQTVVPEHLEKWSSMTFLLWQRGSMPTFTFALQVDTLLWAAWAIRAPLRAPQRPCTGLGLGLG